MLEKAGQGAGGRGEKGREEERTVGVLIPAVIYDTSMM